jgi:hypothetical protein
MRFYANQFAYDNAEPEDNEIHESVHEEAKKQFNDEWLCYTDLGDKTMDVLTKFAQGEKVNDIELQAFKKELASSYLTALERFTKNNIERIEKEMIDAYNSI